MTFAAVGTSRVTATFDEVTTRHLTIAAKSDQRSWPTATSQVRCSTPTSLAALRAVSDVTGGATDVAADPRSVRKVFLDAVSQRLCRPGCRVR